MAKERKTQKPDPHVKLVQELIDETPVRIKMTKHQRELAETYRSGYNSGRHDASTEITSVFTKMLGERDHKLEQTVASHKAGQIHLVHTFSTALFMLGKAEGVPKRADAQVGQPWSLVNGEPNDA